jgi:CheY-like chemotaxis protein
MRILLIEDDEQMRRSLVDRLLQDAEAVYEACDFGSAVDLIPDADGIVCDDAFPFVAGEPPFEFAWRGLHDAARAQRKPFVLLTEHTAMWLDASRQDVEVYRKRFVLEAIEHLVQAVGKNPPAAAMSPFADASCSPGATTSAF